jgi:hypothetical protein
MISRASHKPFKEEVCSKMTNKKTRYESFIPSGQEFIDMLSTLLTLCKPGSWFLTSARILVPYKLKQTKDSCHA